MNAREYFEDAGSCQRLIDGAMARLEAMRAVEGARAQGYGPCGPGGGADPMARTDARLDYEARIEREIAGYRATVEGAQAVLAGVRAANPGHPLWADAVELRYIFGRKWDAVGDSLGVSERTARDECAACLDWVDAVGIARAREGMGQAALL